MSETRRAFHDELAEVQGDVVRLGAMATEAVQAGTDALLEADLSAVERVVANDADLDALTHGIEARCYQLLARQQPMAGDMRTLVTVLRVIHELERAGDLMVNVAKTTRRLFPATLDPKVRGIVHRMREQAACQLYLAVSAFADRDPRQAAVLCEMDDEMDELQKELFRAIFGSQAADDAAVHRAVQVALVGRYFERIADHAVNTGERVAYMVTGAFPEDESTKSLNAR